MQPKTITVLTMNLGAHEQPFEERQDLLRSELMRISPDLIAFQHAVYEESRNQAFALVDSAVYQTLHQDEGRPSWAGYGIAVASRFPFTLAECLSLDLRGAQDFPVAAMAVRVEIPGVRSPLLFVNAKPYWELDAEQEREVQALMTIDLIDRHRTPGGGPSILAGDFDATPDSASIRFLTGQQSLQGRSCYFRDAWEHAGDDTDGATWSHENGNAAKYIAEFGLSPKHKRRIDYIFLEAFFGENPKNGTILDCQRTFMKDRDGIWPSNHYGVLATIGLW